jgi:signal peptidase I
LDAVKAVPASKRKLWALSIAAGVVLVVVVLTILAGAGIRAFEVKTPSMGTVAPVGTLVIVQPQKSYAIGNVISFERSDRSYTHRIVAQTWQGWSTKGDLNGSPDPLPVTNAQIIGKVVFIGKYLGFVVDALPWILLGCAIVYAVTLLPRVRPSWRWQIRLVGWSLVTSIVALWQHPWVNMVMLGYVPDDNVGVDMHLVNTGIFPVRVLGTILQSGQDAVVNQTMADAGGRYSVTPQLALNLGWFLGLLFLCLAPVIASLLIPVEDPIAVVVAEVTEVPERKPKVVASRPRLWVLADRFAPALVVVAAVVAVSLVLQAGTQSAYAASIRNSTDTAGTRTWFSCQNAETGTSGARFVWGLTALGNQTDLTTNGRTGTLKNNGTAATTSTSSPCPHDTQGSMMFNGGTCIYTGTAVTSNETFSEEVWFRTTSTSLNGKLMGFADVTTPTTQTHYDRHVYIDPTGRVVFGVWPSAQSVVSSPAGKSYADGVWHHVVVTSAPGTVSLYLDGNFVSSRADTAGQDVYSGYWEIGCGLLAQWQDAAGTPQNFSSYYTGNLRLAAVYDVTLTATQVKEHYVAGTA